MVHKTFAVYEVFLESWATCKTLVVYEDFSRELLLMQGLGGPQDSFTLYEVFLGSWSTCKSLVDHKDFSRKMFHMQGIGDPIDSFHGLRGF